MRTSAIVVEISRSPLLRATPKHRARDCERRRARAPLRQVPAERLAPLVQVLLLLAAVAGTE
jgi:hypothetical protein